MRNCLWRAGVGAMLGMLSLVGATAVAAQQALPNTPECWQYVNYARTAGAMNTLGPLVELYNLCMRSAYTRPEIEQYECAPGYYLWYEDGQPRCAELPPGE